MLNNMFTVAAETEADETSACALLFHKAEGLFTEEELTAIASNPTCRELMGDLTLMTRLKCTQGEELLLSREIEEYAISRMPYAVPGETIMLLEVDTGMRHVDIQKVYSTCMNPHRIIVGCTECLRANTKSLPCELKALWTRMDDEAPVMDAADAVQKLKSRKTMIEGFTYVSPSLTKSEHFVSPYRRHDDHDFSEVEDNSDIVRKGLRERGRRRQFAKVACSECLVKSACHSETGSLGEKYCTGPYKETEVEAEEQIIGNSTIPFTEKQLMFLALNSGRLRKRYNRKIYWTTFRYDTYHGLQYGICRYSTGSFTPFGTYKQAETFIRENNGEHVHEVEKKQKLDRRNKAVLLELSKIRQSPGHRAGWGTTYYDVLGIEYDRWNRGWELRFKYNHSGGYRSDGMLVPWRVEARAVGDIYKCYSRFRTLHKKDHENNYYNAHR
jgi:hypothetical protein